MNIIDIQKRIEEITAISGDDEAAHSKEDQLLWDFVTAVSSCRMYPASLVEMANELLKCQRLNFNRWCA